MHAGAAPVPRPAQVAVTNQAAAMDEIDALMEELVLDTVLQAIQPELQVSLPRVAICHGKPEQQYHVPCAMHSCFVPCARCHVPYIRALCHVPGVMCHTFVLCHIADLRRLAYYAGCC